MDDPYKQVAVARRSDHVSDAELAALVERARQDPFAAPVLAHIQEHGRDMILALCDEVTKMLAALEDRPHLSPGGKSNVSAMASAAREREAAARQRRELAHDIVIGALVNLDNPDWDPFDASTSHDASSSVIRALLESRPG